MTGPGRPPKRKRGRPRGATKRDYTRPLRRVRQLIRSGLSERKAVETAAREFQIPLGTLRNQFAQHKLEEPAPPVRPPMPPLILRPAPPSDEELRLKIQQEIQAERRREQQRQGLEWRIKGLV